MAVAFAPAIAEFLKQPLFASIVTLNADGSAHLTYVWYEFDGRRFLISTTADRKKGRNVARDPRVTLGMLDPQNPYRYVSVSGRVQVTREGANDLILRLAIRYQGPEQGETNGRNMQGPQRVVLTLEPDQIQTFGF